MEGWHANSPLGRPGQPSEVAPTFVFLASPEASLYCELACSSSVTQLTVLHRWSNPALLPYR